MITETRTQTPQPQTAQETPILTLQDRCDGPGLSKQYQDRSPRCGAQAFVRVHLKSGDLDFCGHHYSAYEPTFMARGYEVDDQRESINTKPSVSNADI